jgi:RES domain-containing protein
MPPPRKVRDNALIDALAASVADNFDNEVWRVVREGRDPLRGSSSGGRWDDGTFDVLYTSVAADGALAEIYFHLMRGQPVLPSKMTFYLYGLQVRLRRLLRLLDLDALARLGVDTENYGSREYMRRHEEYPRTQDIAEAAHFLDFDGLLVPSGRWQGHNVVLFTDRVPPDALSVIRDGTPVDWAQWKADRERTP